MYGIIQSRMAPQWSCQQQSADNCLLWREIFAEWILMLKRRWNRRSRGEEKKKKGMTVFTARAGRCKWSVIADLERFEQMAEFLFDADGGFEQTSMQSEKTLMRREKRTFSPAELEGCIPKGRVTSMIRTWSRSTLLEMRLFAGRNVAIDSFACLLYECQV